MTKRLFWQTAILAAGMGSLPAFAATATEAQAQEEFRVITAEESASIQDKLNPKETDAPGEVKPVALTAQNPAAAETPEAAVTAEPEVAAKPVAKPAPAETRAPAQETVPAEPATQSNAPKPDTSRQDAEAQAIESHKAKMALRQEMIRQAAEQQGMQQKKLSDPTQETASPEPVATAAEQRRQQVLSEIETRRQLAEKGRAESSTAADVRSKQHQDALDALRASQNARAQAMAQRREAAEKAMQVRREEMEQRIQQHQEGPPPGSVKSHEELISSMQDRRKTMREHMAKRRAEQQSTQAKAEQENKSLAQADEQRAKMEVRRKQRQAEMAARRKAMSERIDAAIDNMGRNPWGPPPGTR